MEMVKAQPPLALDTNRVHCMTYPRRTSDPGFALTDIPCRNGFVLRMQAYLRTFIAWFVQGCWGKQEKSTEHHRDLIDDWHRLFEEHAGFSNLWTPDDSRSIEVLLVQDCLEMLAPRQHFEQSLTSSVATHLITSHPEHRILNPSSSRVSPVTASV